MKTLLPLSVIFALAAVPAFAECVAPLNDVKIPNGNKATMNDMVAVNQEIQENSTEVDVYLHCLKDEQKAKLAAAGPDIADEQKSKIAGEYGNRQQAEVDKLQSLAARYDVAERSFRAKQANEKAAEEDAQETAAVQAAEQDAAEKARHDAVELKADEETDKPTMPAPPKTATVHKSCGSSSDKKPSTSPGATVEARSSPPCT